MSDHSHLSVCVCVCVCIHYVFAHCAFVCGVCASTKYKCCGDTTVCERESEAVANIIDCSQIIIFCE